MPAPTDTSAFSKIGDGDKLSESAAHPVPQGSIEIIYCDHCGMLILGGKKNAVARSADAGFHCKKCAAAAPPVKNGAMPVAETKVMAVKHPSSMRIQPVKAGDSSRRLAETGDRSRRLAPPAAAESSKNGMVMLYAGAGGVALLLMLVFAFSGSSSAPHPATKPETVAKAPAKSINDAPRPIPAAAVQERRSNVPPAESEARDPQRPSGLSILEQTPAQAQAQEKAKEPEPAAGTETPKAQVQKDQKEESAPAAASLGALKAPAEPAPAAKVEEAPKLPVAPPPAGPAAAIAKGGDEDDPAKAKNNPASKPADPALAEKTPPKDNPTAAPAKVPAAPKAPPKPAWVRGRPSDLFPPDRASTLGDYVSPAADVNQRGPSGIKETKYDGWTWNTSKAEWFTAWSVSGGGLSVEKPGNLVLDGFTSEQYDLSFELDLASKSALALHYSGSKEMINLLIFTNKGVLPGTWDPNKQKDNVKPDNTKAKPHGLTEQWLPFRVVIRKDYVEIYVNNKSIFKNPPPVTPLYGRLGFLPLGENGNATPAYKLRKVILLAP